MMWALLLLACGEGKNEDAPDADDTATPLPEQCDAQWDAWASGFFTTYCQSCHSETSPQRYDAPIGVDLDDVGDVRAWSDRIRIRVLEEETMPMGGGVPSSDLDRLDAWLDCLESAQ